MAKRTSKTANLKNTNDKRSGAARKSRKTAKSKVSHARQRAKGPSSSDVLRRIEAAPRRRITTSLSEAQTRLIVNAVRHADRIRLPLNRMMTVDWTLAGIDDPHAGRQHLLRMIYDWMRTRSCASAYVWVMENGPRHGLHSHILIHVPPHLRKDFNRRLRGWRTQVGIPWKRGIVHSRHIGHTANAAFAQGERPSYLANIGRAVAYVLKAATATARRTCGVRLAPTQFTPVDGKRCGTSRNIGEAAIRKFGAYPRGGGPGGGQ